MSPHELELPPEPIPESALIQEGKSPMNAPWAQGGGQWKHQGLQSHVEKFCAKDLPAQGLPHTRLLKGHEAASVMEVVEGSWEANTP